MHSCSVYSTDTLIHLPWSEQSVSIARWVDLPGNRVLEGCATVRGPAQGLGAGADALRPRDLARRAAGRSEPGARGHGQGVRDDLGRRETGPRGARRRDPRARDPVYRKAAPATSTAAPAATRTAA
jgi:hypothetical protein